MKFHPFPILESERLLLRELQVTDAPEVLYLRSDPTVNQYIDRPADRQTTSLMHARIFIDSIARTVKSQEAIMWAIVKKGNPKTIGTVCLWKISEDGSQAELGYSLGVEFHRQGIMSEAVEMVIDFGFNQIGLQKIEAFTHVENTASRRLLEKHAFQLNEKRRDTGNLNNRIFELRTPH